MSATQQSDDFTAFATPLGSEKANKFRSLKSMTGRGRNNVLTNIQQRFSKLMPNTKAVGGANTYRLT